MAFTYGFYNSKNKDRRYNADQMSQLFDGILNDGVFNKVGELMMVVPGTGLQVLVKSGRAWFNSTWSYNDAAYPLNLSTPDVAVPRIDAVVLEVDHTESVRRNRLLVVKGLAASNPEKPTLVNTDLIHQHPLAYVTLRAGAESIYSGDIEIMVGKDECPFVTGILQTASLEDLYDDWNNQFTTWFDDVKSQLEGDVATNLLNMINERVKIADKASISEVSAGTNDDKWVTPKGVAAIAGKVKDSASNSLITTRSLLIDFDKTPRYFKNLSPGDGANKTCFLYPSNLYGATIGSNQIKIDRWPYSGVLNSPSTILTYNFKKLTSPGTFRGIGYAVSPGNAVAVFRYNNALFMYDIINNKIHGLDDNGSYANVVFATTSYIGLMRWSKDGTVYFYYISRSSANSDQNASSATTFNASLTGSNYRILGVYNNILLVGSTVNNTEFHVHKVDIASKTYQANAIVMNSVGHTSNVPLDNAQETFVPCYFDSTYAYVLPRYNDSSKNTYIVGSRIIRIDMSNFTSNWDSVTTFFTVPSNSSAAKYVGHRGSKAYIIVGGSSINYAVNYSYLLEVTDSTQAISKTGLKPMQPGKISSMDFSFFNSGKYNSAIAKINNDVYANSVMSGFMTVVDTKLSEVYRLTPINSNSSSNNVPVIFGTNFATYNVLELNGSTMIENVSYMIGFGGPAIYDIIKG